MKPGVKGIDGHVLGPLYRFITCFVPEDNSVYDPLP